MQAYTHTLTSDDRCKIIGVILEKFTIIVIINFIRLTQILNSSVNIYVKKLTEVNIYIYM